MWVAVLTNHRVASTLKLEGCMSECAGQKRPCYANAEISSENGASGSCHCTSAAATYGHVDVSGPCCSRLLQCTHFVPCRASGIVAIMWEREGSIVMLRHTYMRLWRCEGVGVSYVYLQFRRRGQRLSLRGLAFAWNGGDGCFTVRWLL